MPLPALAPLALAAARIAGPALARIGGSEAASSIGGTATRMMAGHAVGNMIHGGGGQQQPPRPSPQDRVNAVASYLNPNQFG